MTSEAPTYDQKFFLALARPDADTDDARLVARDRWNAWRDDPANKHTIVDFSGVDFGNVENRGIHFAAFNFGRAAKFDSATFDDEATFERASFGPFAKFDGARFRRQANFSEAIFGNVATFENSIFEMDVNFNLCKFNGHAYFRGACFIGEAYFASTSFSKMVDFSGGVTETWIGREAAARLIATKQKILSKDDFVKSFVERQKDENFGPNIFLDINFAGSKFYGPAKFDRRDFHGYANFTGVQF